MQIRLVPIDLLFSRSGPSATPAPVFSEDLRPRRRWVWWARWGLQRPLLNVTALDRDRLIADAVLDENACLAKAMGKRWIRVTMPEVVASQWDERSTHSLREIVRKTKRREFYNPVDHIDFRRARVLRSDSVRLDLIRRLLGWMRPGLSGLDIGCNMGYTCHHLQRLGFRMTGIDPDEYHLSVGRALNETYRLDVDFLNCQLAQFETSHQYDVVLALAVLYHIFFEQTKDQEPLHVVESHRIFFRQERQVPSHLVMSQDEVMGKIDRLARCALIWESGLDPDQEIDIITSKSGLTRYLRLGSTSVAGRKRELGVFLRPGTAGAHYLFERYRRNLTSTWSLDI